MKILAIDTSTEACSAALYVDGDVSQRYQVAPRQHAELILAMCDELLVEANLTLEQLDAIAFDRGPGAFTGVRIATGVVQGIAFAHQLPVVAVSSLAAIAFAAYLQQRATNIMSAIDARMDEVYWACYECSEQGVVEVVNEQVCAPNDVILPGSGSWLGQGSGWDSYQQQLLTAAGKLVSETDGAVYPDAQTVVKLAAIAYQKGETLTAEQAIPVYLRDKVAKKKAQQ